MHDNTPLTLARIDRYLAEWIAPALVRATHPLEVSGWEVPDEPVSFAEARAATYHPHPVGTRWGAPWGTVWLHVTGTIPDDWPLRGTRAELHTDLGWIAQQPGFQSEGAAWSPDGTLVKGISPRNAWVPLPQAGGSHVEFYIEAAANPDVPGNQWTKPTVLGDKATAGTEPQYRLRAVDVALVDTAVEALLADARTLRGLADALSADSGRRAKVIAALEDMCDAVDPDDVAGTASAGREALAAVLSSPADASAHRIAAVGHAHIDSAWLWPVRETVRKVSRTVANVLALMDEDPDLTFAFSSAQQFAWIQEYYPELFERLAARVREGRIVPVGGMWVESDTNMVGAEALVRQFLEGKGYFISELGVDPTSVWLPDSFGYTGAFPQVATLAGCTDFLTQKLSWNDTNKVPHHTFWWEGIDGSRVFTHFPPVDTYNSDLSALELEHAASQFRDKGRANRSLAPFGYGDGGGGPTREMIAQAHRAADLEGSPAVELTTPDAFFDAARQEYASLAPTWVGEMYLEYHRGTYTTQSRTKRGNRRSEHLLREAELWATTAAVRAGAPYPHEALRRIWRQVLLLQFHDILPGTSIAWVHREAEAHYEAIAAELRGLIDAAMDTLGGSDDVVANPAPFARHGVPAGGIGRAAHEPAATREHTEDGWVLTNEGVTIRIDEQGLVTSAVVAGSGRESIPADAPGNLLQLARDIPNTWEAWDIDEHYKRAITDLTEGETSEATAPDGSAAVRVVRRFSASTVTQLLWLAKGSDPTLHVVTDVDWHERQKLLKLGFTADVHAAEASSEIQFGHVTRPTHTNTSWDAARFETVAHRWVHVGEPGFGMAVANDGSYGHDITRVRLGVDGAGAPERVGSRVRVSLVRAPLFPDPVADQGEHRFAHAVTFGAGIEDAIRSGYDLNLPLRPVSGADVAPLVAVSGDQVVVEAIKLAQDGSGDVIVRLYESQGARAQTRVSLDCGATAVSEADLLERPRRDTALDLQDGAVEVTLRPFQVVTLRISRG